MCVLDQVMLTSFFRPSKFLVSLKFIWISLWKQVRQIYVLILTGLKYDRRKRGIVKRVGVFDIEAQKLEKKQVDCHILVDVCVRVHALKSQTSAHPPHCVCLWVQDTANGQSVVRVYSALRWHTLIEMMVIRTVAPADGHIFYESLGALSTHTYTHTHALWVVSNGFLVIALGTHSEVMSE